jgi:hypothetical protein
MTPAQTKDVPKPAPPASVRAKGGDPNQAVSDAKPISLPPVRGLFYLRDLGRLLDDLESTRIRNSNRIGAYEREFGSAPPHYLVIQDRLKATEHETVLELQREWRKHPLASWAKTIPGAGEKLMARLIAETDDPAQRPNVAKYWQYCGHGNPHLKRRKGMTQEEAFRLGNPHAKKRAYLLGAQFVKTMQSPYRLVYEERRSKTGDRDWTLGHQHADAIRVTTKAFLRDLWLAAQAIRTADSMPRPPESQESP